MLRSRCRRSLRDRCHPVSVSLKGFLNAVRDRLEDHWAATQAAVRPLKLPVDDEGG